MSKEAKAKVPTSDVIGDRIAQYMGRPGVSDRYLDGWASVRTVRAGIGSSCRYGEAFPKVPFTDPEPFPANHRGESVIRDESEEGADKKYSERPGFDASLESMCECVERALKTFQGPCYLRGLLIFVHPVGPSRYRANAYPDDPFASFAEAENGPNVSRVTKQHQTTTYLNVYRSFKQWLAKEIANVEEKSA